MNSGGPAPFPSACAGPQSADLRGPERQGPRTIGPENIRPSRAASTLAQLRRGQRAQRIRPESVRTACSLKAPKDDQHDDADERNEDDQPPPAAAVSVVQPAYPHRERWQERGQAPDRRERHHVARQYSNIDDRRDDVDQNGEQDPVPEFRSRRPAGETNIVAKA